MMEEEPIPTGRLKRATVTGMAATKLGAKQLAHLSKKALKGKAFSEEEQSQHEEELGKLIIKTLGMLRGTALKVSQALSQEADLLPEAMRKELAKACHKMSPLNRALILKVFQKEWGMGPGKLFESFDSEAFAAASLGQVHRAVSKNGENIAVKVQYPGIGATIGSDLRMMRTMLVDVAGRSGALPRRDMLSDCLDEIEERLLEEIDYRNEAENLTWFRENVAIEGIRIPKVFEETSGGRVLSMERLDGMHFDDWLGTGPSQTEKDAVGQKLIDFFSHCFYNLKRIHADPHSGNFMVLSNGDLGVLDFGCVKQVDREFPGKMMEALKAIVANRDGEHLEEVLEAYKGIGLYSENYTIDLYERMSHPTFGPLQDWLRLPYLDAVYDFGQHPRMPNANLRQSAKTVKEMDRLPKDYIFFDRAYNGVVNLLRRIGARVETGGMLWG
ncbi:AarF/ABC1/UbiB kinase family protein [Puniceicoccaceae bacterium K14]|nr:AarF/ABC1/UbiB kinase family protein [Puniceicoccaceae bacterium K14]